MANKALTKAATAARKHAHEAAQEALGFVRVVDESAGATVERALPDGGMSMPVLVLEPSDSDAFEIYALLIGMTGPDNCFAGAEFLVKMTLPKPAGARKGYPHAPPDFSVLTPNGVFKVASQTPCVSIGRYHASDRGELHGYTPGMKLLGFIRSVWGIFSDPASLGGGINVIYKGLAHCADCARGSQAYNRERYPALMAQFDSLYNLRVRHEYWAEQAKK